MAGTTKNHAAMGGGHRVRTAVPSAGSIGAVVHSPHPTTSPPWYKHMMQAGKQTRGRAFASHSPACGRYGSQWERHL